MQFDFGLLSEARKEADRVTTREADILREPQRRQPHAEVPAPAMTGPGARGQADGHAHRPFQAGGRRSAKAAGPSAASCEASMAAYRGSRPERSVA